MSKAPFTWSPYHVVCRYRDGSGSYINNITATSAAAAFHTTQLKAIVDQARPTLFPLEQALLLTVGRQTKWDFTRPELQRYRQFALDHVATYQVVAPGTPGSDNLKLVE